MKNRLMATTLAVLAPTVALAADPPNAYAPNSEAFANVFGPYVGGGQTSQVSVSLKKGVLDPGGTYDTTSGSTQTSSHSADGYQNFAGVVGSSGNAASMNADLHNGTLKGLVTIGDGQIQRGFAQGKIADTVIFNNTSGGTIYLPFALSFDGAMSGPELGANSSALTLLDLYGRGACGADLQVCESLKFAGGYDVSGNSIDITYYGDGGTSITNFGDPNLPAAFSVTRNSAGTTFDTILAASLAIPVGYAYFSFQMTEALDCSGRLTVCDFSHTSALGFAPLPDGLSYSSSSGAFQIAAAPGQPGGVPEPSTWAMLIVGFLGVGGAIRQRRRGLAT